jgi:hypothetical protein
MRATEPQIPARPRHFSNHSQGTTMSSKNIYMPICRADTEARIITLLEQKVKPSYVYSIKDKTNGKRYVGVRTAQVRKEADPRLDLGVEYFSSTSIMELRNRIKNNHEEFVFFILGVFATSEEARELEDTLLKSNSVYHNDSFYNISVNNSHRDTTGMVPVKTENGNILITKEEFDTGEYENVCAGTVSVTDLNSGNIVRISLETYRKFPEKYKSHYDGVVSVIDSTTSERMTITCTEYHANPSRYIRNTDGMVVIRNPDKLSTKKTILIPKSEYDNNVHVTPGSGTITVRLRSNPSEYSRVSTEEYHDHPELYMNPAEGVVYVKYRDTGENVTVSSEEYTTNKHMYCMRHVNKSWVYDFTNKQFITVTTEERTELQISKKSVFITIMDNVTKEIKWVALSRIKDECRKLGLRHTPVSNLNLVGYTITKIKKPTLEDFRAYQDFWESFNDHSSS